MLRQLIRFNNCPFLERQQSAARAHLQRELAKFSGEVIDIRSRTVRMLEPQENRRKKLEVH